MHRRIRHRLPASLSDLAGKAAGWPRSWPRSWSGSLALVNVISLLIVTPIVAFYMLNDWDHMVAKVDGWLPRDHRNTIRAFAREIDEAMAGFIRGQGTVCLLLGLFYAVALSFSGLNFGLLIGLGAGLLSFIPYVGTIIGGVLAIGMALIQFWPDWIQIDHRRHFRRRPVHRGQFPLALSGRQPHRPASGLADVRAVRLRLSVRLCRAAAGRAARRRCRRAGALRPPALSASPLYLGVPGEMPSPKSAGRPPNDAGEGRQLAFDLPHRPALGRDDFLVTPLQRQAVALIDPWPNWPANAPILLGPPGSGKSHLAAVWHEPKAVAARSPLCDIRDGAVPCLPEAAVIEDALPALWTSAGFFHLLNLARSRRPHVLLTAQTRPVHWDIAVPDLLSRLKAACQCSKFGARRCLAAGRPGQALRRPADRGDEAHHQLLLSRMPRALARRAAGGRDRPPGARGTGRGDADLRRSRSWGFIRSRAVWRRGLGSFTTVTFVAFTWPSYRAYNPLNSRQDCAMNEIPSA